MEVPRLKLPLKTRRDEAKRALVLLARGDGAVRNVLVGPVSDIFDCESVMTLLAMIYSVLVPGGTIDIGAHPRLLPLCAEEIRAGHLERSPPGARPLFFNGCAIRRDLRIEFLDPEVAELARTTPSCAVKRLKRACARLRAARTVQRFWRAILANPHCEVGDRALRKGFHRSASPFKRQRLAS